MRKSITALFLFTIVALVSSQSLIINNQKTPIQKSAVAKDTVKKAKVLVLQQEIKKDSVEDKMGELVMYKKDAHASYYADKFHGRRTASGALFDMHKYTAKNHESCQWTICYCRGY
jgi:rare lipoprotein A